MKKHVMMAAAAAAGLAFLPASALAVDFSGTWLRDATQSSPSGFPVYWVTRLAPLGGNNNAFILEVQHAGSTLKAKDPIRPLRNYTLDGKPYEAMTDSHLGKVTYSAALVGETLSVTATQPYGGMPGNVQSREIQTWSLSPDGKVLTIALVREAPGNRQTFKDVYKRQ